MNSADTAQNAEKGTSGACPEKVCPLLFELKEGAQTTAGSHSGPGGPAGGNLLLVISAGASPVRSHSALCCLNAHFTVDQGFQTQTRTNKACGVNW